MKPLIFGALFFLTALILFLTIRFAGFVGIVTNSRAKLATEFTQVQTAVLAYYTEYAEYPVAPDNATLIKKLSQANPRRIPFLTFRASEENSRGELLDPWGTPVRMPVGADGGLRMTSAGPDRIFGTADDINSDFMVNLGAKSPR
jgi:hypothetical protein